MGAANPTTTVDLNDCQRAVHHAARSLGDSGDYYVSPELIDAVVRRLARKYAGRRVSSARLIAEARLMLCPF